MVSSGNYGLLANLDYSGYQGSIGLVPKERFSWNVPTSLPPSLPPPYLKHHMLILEPQNPGNQKS